MIICRELTEFLDDYLGGELEAARRSVFEEHLAVCVDCRNYLESYRATMRLAKWAGRDVPEDVPADLIKAVVAARDAGAR